jgi:hypothetical protein
VNTRILISEGLAQRQPPSHESAIQGSQREGYSYLGLNPRLDLSLQPGLRLPPQLSLSFLQ